VNVFVAVLLLLASAQASTVHYVPVSAVDGLAIEVSLPKNWILSRVRRENGFNDHRAVVFAANNRNDDTLMVDVLRRELPNGGREFSFGPGAFQAALKPGTVYVEVEYMVGGPPPISTPYAWTKDDEPKTAIQRSLKAPDDDWTTKSLVVWRVTFVHWGKWWEAYVAARPPYSQKDIDQAFSILESLRFPDVPVVHPVQAAEVAIPALPTKFREQFLPDPKCACCRRYTVETVSTEKGFLVTFTLMDAQTGKVLRSESVDVTRDGRASGH
jgi:hypothetical protein